MSADIVVIIIFSVMGLAAHGARKQPWIEWTLRVIYCFAFVAELWTALVILPTRDGTEAVASAWSVGVTAVMATMTGLILFRPCRIGMSYALTALNDLVSGQLLYGAWWVKNAPVAIEGGYVDPHLRAPVVEAKPVEEPKAEAEAAVAEASTAEADAAKPEADAAKTEADAAKTEADAAKPEADAAKTEADAAKPEADAVKTEADAVKTEANVTKTEADSAKAEADAAKTEADAQISPSPTSNSSSLSSPTPAASGAPHGLRTLVRTESLVGTAAPIIGAKSWKDYFLFDRVFMADSIPHLNGMWIYITVLGSLLANINLENFAAPMIGIPFPVPLDSLVSYNFLGLILLAVSGVGIIVSRSPKETMKRLGLVKPAGWHIGVALLMVVVTAAYDYLWNPSGQGVGGKLAMYNAGTFAAAGGNPGPAAFLALMTGVCAGAGEEILMRGALQPVLGIVPAAILHGVLHGQFQHAPILIVQVAGWSIIMGIVRRYTNTTTTLITHATWNFITTFLFAFNP